MKQITVKNGVIGVKALETFVPFKDQEEAIDLVKIDVLSKEGFDNITKGLIKSIDTSWKPEEGNIYPVPDGYEVEFETVIHAGDLNSIDWEEKVAILTPITNP